MRFKLYWLISCITSISLSLFTEEKCAFVVIDGVYLSDVNQPGDTIKVSATNTNSTGCIFPDPSWKIKHNNNDVVIYNEEIVVNGLSTCMTDTELFTLSKDSTTYNISAGDNVSFTIQLWVNNNQELACEYQWNSIIHPYYDKCHNVVINGLYPADDYNQTNKMWLNVSLVDPLAPLCDTYPTFLLYNDANNQLFGRMMRSGTTYCLVAGKYPINVTSTALSNIGDTVSLTIELWSLWREFRCAFEWSGRIDYSQMPESTEEPLPSSPSIPSAAYTTNLYYTMTLIIMFTIVNLRL